MKAIKKPINEEIHPFWGSSFIKGIPGEIERINKSLGLELKYTVNQPGLIDGDHLRPKGVVFVIEKRSWVHKETYCLYGLYEEGMLKGYIGKSKEGEIKTLRELGGIKDLEKGNSILHKWLQGLIKTSCEKI